MNLQPQTFIFIGRSGSGKGTQANLLEKYLKQIDPSKNTLYIQNGGEIREFIKGDTYTQKIDKVLYDTGTLQPEFLTVHIWSTVLVKRYKEGNHIIFDGTPRKYHEAGVLDSIYNFYKLGKGVVININISREEALKRLLARKRVDDHEKEINKRLDWYESEVIPTMDYYKDNPRYAFLKIDGERTPDEIHTDIIGRIGLV